MNIGKVEPFLKWKVSTLPYQCLPPGANIGKVNIGKVEPFHDIRTYTVKTLKDGVRMSYERAFVHVLFRGRTSRFTLTFLIIV